MSLHAILDELSKRVVGVGSISACFTVTGSERDDGTLKPIPPAFDTPPIALLWPRGGKQSPGGTEHFVHRIDLQVWESAADGGQAVKSLVPYVQLFRALFRTNLNVNGQATRLTMRGYAEPYAEKLNGEQPYLVLAIELEALETHFSNDYSVT